MITSVPFALMCICAEQDGWVLDLANHSGSKGIAVGYAIPPNVNVRTVYKEITLLQTSTCNYKKDDSSVVS